MNREQIKYWMDNLEYYNRFGELSEDDKILLWLARNVYKLTEGMPEEVEQPKKKRKTIDYLAGAQALGEDVLQPVADLVPVPVNRFEIRRPIDWRPVRVRAEQEIEVEGPDEPLREE